MSTLGTMVPTLVAVDWARPELTDTVTLGLAPHLGAPPRPGQFHMLWAIGVGEVPISVSGIGSDGRVEHTIRGVGPTTNALVELGPGDEIGVRGPFGRGWDIEAPREKDLLIIAGGLGLAPLRPVIELAASGALDADRVQLLIGAREPGQVLFADQIAGNWSDLSPAVTVDVAEPGWSERVGPVTTLLDGALRRPSRTVAMVCGPEMMMTVVAKQLVAWGVPPRQIQLSLERNMRCGNGHCGHCQIGALFTCVDGPVVTWAAGQAALGVRER